MPSIELLDQVTIDKIAAGEVVERPSSIVKELVENAMDAGADAVTVEIKAGGKELIRVTDNGCGISRDMAARAFWRHSTSKLKSLKDLETITSFGFRGEALSSIAAVSQVELLTKTQEEFVGTRYLVEGGKEKSISDAGLPDGTTILVKNLFYNTPARSKFLKSDQTEAGYIATMMEQLALSHPSVSMQLIVYGSVKLQSSGNGKREDVIYQIYGREIAKNLLPVSYQNGPYSVTGYVGKPVISRGNRNFECYFVNGRYVQNKIVAKAIEDTYHNHNYLMQHQFPFALLYFDVDGHYVDVNVHPAKLEVRFSEGPVVYDFLTKALEDALAQKEMIPEAGLKAAGKSIVKPEDPKEPAKPVLRAEPFQKSKLEELKKEITKDSPYEEKYSKDSLFKNTKSEEVFIHSVSEKQAAEKPAPAVQEDFTSVYGIAKTETKYFNIIGQVFATYWIVEFDGKVYIIDQHAAHEKVNFEKFMKRFRENNFTSQRILPPMVITLNAAEEEIIQNNMPAFEKFGFEISSFGGKEYIISAVPAELYGYEPREFFDALLDEFDEKYRKNDTPESIEIKLATAACKASVRGGDVLTADSAEALLKELFNLENPYNCPHGRPTMTSFSKHDLEKMFKRIV